MQNVASLPNAGALRVSQIEDQVNALQINAEELRKTIAELEATLGSVILPFPVNPGPAQTPEPVLVPLAATLRSTCDAFRTSVDRLRQINGAVELTRV